MPISINTLVAGTEIDAVPLNENFVALKNAAEASTAADAATATEVSGQQYSGTKSPPTTAHEQIPTSEIKTPALTSGQVLVVHLTVVLQTDSNAVNAALTVNGTEEGFTIASANATGFTVTTVTRRITGKTGVISLAANTWASSNFGHASCSIYYEVRNG